MKLIPLTQGKFAQVDDCDYDYLMQWKWYCAKAKEQNKTTYYAQRAEYPNGKQKTILMHRQILGLISSHIHIDHRDFDGLNNMCINTRVATRSQNRCNVTSRGETGFLGVFKQVTKKKLATGEIKSYVYYGCQVGKNGKITRRGGFKNPEAAAIARDKIAEELHGSFVSLNFKKEPLLNLPSQL